VNDIAVPEAEDFPFKINDVPIDFEVKGLQTFKLSIPIYVREDVPLKANETYDI